jgi:hypothetical protein
MAEPSTKSEMARSSECTEQYAQKVLDTADFVRDACSRQTCSKERQFLPELAEYRWPTRGGRVNFTFKDWIALVISSVLAYAIFGNISSKAGYPRWHGLLMAIPFVNVAVLVMFAYSTWPIESELLQLKLGGSRQIPLN